VRRKSPTVVRRQALRVQQDRKHPVYLLTLTAEQLLQIADVSRLSRGKAGELVGYQRAEVKRHIRNIVEYLDSGDVLFPNSLILSLPSTTRFFRKQRTSRHNDQDAEAGTLEIVLPRKGRPKTAWIVDGQQRAVALSRSRHTGLAVPVNAFVTDDVDIQREQFLRINSTKPLPRGLITELLPEVSTVLPAKLAARKGPSALCEMLNRHPDSPFRGLIRRASAGREGGHKAFVSDTTLVQVIQDSLTSPTGCLFPYRNVATGETDFEGIEWVLLTYWNAVKSIFPGAWGRPPKQSRLMHSAGLRAMGRLMDRMMASVEPTDTQAASRVRRELGKIRSACRWTAGTWDECGGLEWNAIQNVPSHVRMLSNFLLRAHLEGRETAA
jgi:DGQHR domain-containing protein